MGPIVNRTQLATAALGLGAGIVLYALWSSKRCVPLLGQPGLKVLLVGDSLGVGLTKPFKASAVALGEQAMVAAVSGKTMSYWLGQGGLASIVASFRPDVVLVCLGTNDSKTNYTTEQLTDQLQRVLATASSTGAKVAWILPPKLPFPERVGPLVRAAGVPFFDSAQLDLPQADGIHPTGAGFAAWNEAIWRWATCA